MVKDNISNLIICLKNASRSGKDEALVSLTKMNQAVLDVLQKENFVESHKPVEDRKILVAIKYNNGVPAITDVKRISRQSKRIYKGSKEITPIKNGYGIAIITTPNGILTDKEAREKNIGGEVLFEIW